MNSNIIECVNISDSSDIDCFVRRYSLLNLNYVNKLHMHKFVQVNYVFGGKAIHVLNDTEYEISKGDIFVIPPLVKHMIKAQEDSDAVIYELEFTPEFISGGFQGQDKSNIFPSEMLWDFMYLNAFLLKSELVNPGYMLSIKTQEQVEQILREALSEYLERRDGFIFILRSLIVKLLVIVSREFNVFVRESESSELYAAQKQNIFNALDYINEHYSEPLSLNDVAKSAIISSSYFQVLFKYFTGQSYIQYLTSVRLKEALRLLEETDDKIIDIALAVGFNYVNHFNRMFKKTMHITPLQYRKKIKSNKTGEKINVI